jgi:hypothetical protein
MPVRLSGMKLLFGKPQDQEEVFPDLVEKILEPVTPPVSNVIVLPNVFDENRRSNDMKLRDEAISAHDEAVRLKITMRAIVAKRGLPILSPINWGIVVSNSQGPIAGKVKPVGVQWFQGSDAKTITYHSLNEIILLHEPLGHQHLVELERQ